VLLATPADEHLAAQHEGRHRRGLLAEQSRHLDKALAAFRAIVHLEGGDIQPRIAGLQRFDERSRLQAMGATIGPEEMQADTGRTAPGGLEPQGITARHGALRHPQPLADQQQCNSEAADDASDRVHVLATAESASV
jgi:hypothetical protein